MWNPLLPEEIALSFRGWGTSLMLLLRPDFSRCVLFCRRMRVNNLLSLRNNDLLCHEDPTLPVSLASPFDAHPGPELVKIDITVG